MKKISRVASMLGLVALSLNLTSCLSKVTFDEFCTAVKNKTVEEYTKVTFSGKVTSEGITLDMSGASASWKDNDWDVTGSAAQVLIGGVLMATTVDMYTVKEDSSLNYYTGSGFKVENKEDTKNYTEFNSSGYLVVVTDGSNTLKASYSK